MSAFAIESQNNRIKQNSQRTLLERFLLTTTEFHIGYNTIDRRWRHISSSWV